VILDEETYHRNQEELVAQFEPGRRRSRIWEYGAPKGTILELFSGNSWQR
jgi:hypothetical protein